MRVFVQIGLVAFGSAVGGLARWGLGLLAGRLFGAGFPWGTFVINVSGSFILAGAAVLFLECLPARQGLFLLVGTGFCGGYTTFSTFEYETFRLIRDGSWLLAFVNVVGSVVAGFLAVLLAVSLAQGAVSLRPALAPAQPTQTVVRVEAALLQPDAASPD